MQYLSRGKHLLNQLCLNSLFSKPQHPDKGGREEILLHCLLLAFQQISSPRCPLLCLDLFSYRVFKQILNHQLIVYECLLYCALLYLPLYDFPESTHLTELAVTLSYGDFWCFLNELKKQRAHTEN